MLVGLFVASAMLENSTIPENCGKLESAGILIIAIAGITIVWSRR